MLVVIVGGCDEGRPLGSTDDARDGTIGGKLLGFPLGVVLGGDVGCNDKLEIG